MYLLYLDQVVKHAVGSMVTLLVFYSSSSEEQSPGVPIENESVLNPENENQLESESWGTGLGKHWWHYKKNI